MAVYGRVSDLGVTDRRELPCDSDLCPLEEQPMILTTEPPLQPCYVYFKVKSSEAKLPKITQQEAGKNGSNFSICNSDIGCDIVSGCFLSTLCGVNSVRTQLWSRT